MTHMNLSNVILVQANDVTDEDRAFLIREIGSRPWIWNHQHKEYTNHKLRRLTFDELAELMTDDVRQFSADIIRNLWKNLRDQYIRRARIQREREARTGTPSDKLFRWRFYESMDFLASECATPVSLDQDREVAVTPQTYRSNYGLEISDDEEDKNVTSTVHTSAGQRKISTLALPVIEVSHAHQSKRKSGRHPHPKAQFTPTKDDEEQQEMETEQKQVQHRQLLQPQNRLSLYQQQQSNLQHLNKYTPVIVKRLPVLSMPQEAFYGKKFKTEPQITMDNQTTPVTIKSVNIETFAHMVHATYSDMKQNGLDALAHQFKRRIIQDVQRFEDIMQNVLDATNGGEVEANSPRMHDFGTRTITENHSGRIKSENASTPGSMERRVVFVRPTRSANIHNGNN